MRESRGSGAVCGFVCGEVRGTLGEGGDSLATLLYLFVGKRLIFG